MTDPVTPPPTPAPPLETEVSTPEPPAKPKKPKKEKPPKRALLLRLFGIGLWGWIKLIALCIFVGFFIMASNFDPTSPDVRVTAALSSIARQTADALAWAATHFWKPALAGGAVVLPLWVLWRLISLPFRK